MSARTGRGARGATGPFVRLDVPRQCPRTKGYFVNRLLSRVGLRATSVGLLVLGVVGGVYVGQDRATQQQGADAQLVVQVDADEMQLLKERQNEHAAARAFRAQVEDAAATKAAAEAKAAASRARKAEKA